VYVCLGGALFAVFPGEGLEDVASRAWLSVGVMGETGGRTGEAERELERGEWARELCDWDCGDVSTVRPGIVGFLL
jgi:hypothetical protein